MRRSVALTQLPLLLFLLLPGFLLAPAGPARAHNGGVAVAYPIRGITVDGDLSDWPESRQAYAIERTLVGPAPADSADFRAHFRVAYDAGQSSLYLAVEVEDDAVVLDTAASWNGSDGCEIFVDVQHGQKASPCEQHLVWGTHRFRYTSQRGPSAPEEEVGESELGITRTGSRHQYEWRLDLSGAGGAPLAAGQVIGLDLVVGDRDEGGEFSWNAWGREVGKLSGTERRGDLILAPSSEAMGEAAGRVRWGRDGQGIPPRVVRIESKSAPGRLWLQLDVTGEGDYGAPLPAGQYRVEAVDVRVPHEGSKARDFRVGAGARTEVKDLTIKPARDRGALVDQLVEGLASGDPGMAVLVARDGEVLHRKGYGLANLELGAPIAPESKFRLASVSKQFTAVAVMQLAEQGLIDIDAAVSAYLPDYPQSHRITSRQLMSHTAGVPNLLSMPEYFEVRMQPHDLPGVVDIFRDKPLEFEPGTRFSYSNGGYVLLAAIVEQVSGQPFGEYLDEHVFQPLGMVNTGTVDQSAILPGRVSGYLLDEGALVNPYHLDFDVAVGLGNVYSTVDDLHTWDQALYTEQIISADTRQAMCTRQMLTDSTEVAYGLGWRLRKTKGLERVYHDGILNGFFNAFERYPDQRFLAVVLCNNPRLDPWEVAAQIAEIYLSGEMEWAAAGDSP